MFEMELGPVLSLRTWLSCQSREIAEQTSCRSSQPRSAAGERELQVSMKLEISCKESGTWEVQLKCVCVYIYLTVCVRLRVCQSGRRARRGEDMPMVHQKLMPTASV